MTSNANNGPATVSLTGSGIGATHQSGPRVPP
jgi:hypothetical protein